MTYKVKLYKTKFTRLVKQLNKGLQDQCYETCKIRVCKIKVYKVRQNMLYSSAIEKEHAKTKYAWDKFLSHSTNIQLTMTKVD